MAENRRLWYNSGDYEDYGQTPTTDKKDHIKGIYDESDGNHKGFLGYYSPDTSSFANAAHSILGDNQVNTECGSFTFKGLTTVPYSKAVN